MSTTDTTTDPLMPAWASEVEEWIVWDDSSRYRYVRSTPETMSLAPVEMDGQGGEASLYLEHYQGQTVPGDDWWSTPVVALKVDGVNDGTGVVRLAAGDALALAALLVSTARRLAGCSDA